MAIPPRNWSRSGRSFVERVILDSAARQLATSQEDPASTNTKSSPVFIVVKIDWTDDEDGLYEKGTPEYYQLQPGQPGPNEHMDLKLFELTQ
jgi:hypothetical protein